MLDLYYTLPNDDIAMAKLECSLLAISKWESKFGRPYLLKGDKKNEEEVIYFVEHCMPVEGSVIFSCLTKADVDRINDYIANVKTATYIPKDNTESNKVTTSEMIYAIMCVHGISKDYEVWNIKRLMVLFAAVTDLKVEKKKMPMKEVQEQNHKLNAERRKQFNSKG